MLHPKFLQALENDQVLLVHPPSGTRAPLQFFFQEGSKKCSVLAARILEAGGVALFDQLVDGGGKASGNFGNHRHIGQKNLLARLQKSRKVTNRFA